MGKIWKSVKEKIKKVGWYYILGYYFIIKAVQLVVIGALYYFMNK